MSGSHSTDKLQILADCANKMHPEVLSRIKSFDLKWQQVVPGLAVPEIHIEFWDGNKMVEKVGSIK